MQHIALGRMTSPKPQIIAALIAIALSAACTGTRSEIQPSVVPSSTGSPTGAGSPSAQPVSDYSSFIDALEGAGFVVRQGPPRGDGPFSVLTGHGRSVFIDGVRVSTYTYQSEEALGDFRSGVSNDGFSVPVQGGGIAELEWDPPQFYSAGKLLVLYFGDKQRTLDALDVTLGPPFAGSHA
ncbi:MAG: hypothetical protein ACJ740_14365 [Gaiellales bacterium]